jgi:hypothetical protein
MAQRGRKPDPRVEIEVRFVRARHNGTAICVHDGREEVSPWSGKMRLKETWIPMKVIDGADTFDPHRLKPQQKLNLVIREWFALEAGFI